MTVFEPFCVVKYAWRQFGAWFVLVFVVGLVTSVMDLIFVKNGEYSLISLLVASIAISASVTSDILLSNSDNVGTEDRIVAEYKNLLIAVIIAWIVLLFVGYIIFKYKEINTLFYPILAFLITMLLCTYVFCMNKISKEPKFCKLNKKAEEARELTNDGEVKI